MSRIIYPTTNFKATETLVLEKADGIYIQDDQGKQYLEGMSGLWCTSLGYNNQELIDAATQQLHDLSYSHMFSGKTHKVGMQLSETLAEMVPVDNARIFFGHSGSDANDSQIKLLRYYFNAIGKPEKRKIIARQRSYHGVTIGAACLTGLPINHANFDLPVDALGIIRTDAPYYLRDKLDDETESQFVARIVGNLEQQILAEGPETIAAFIAEPITGASGVIIAPDGYYAKVQALLKKYDIFFWADEVITGFGRTGNDFGSTTMGFKPDMMSLAKQLSSAYQPISAAVIRGDMYDAMVEPCAELGVFGHGYTYSAHPVASAVALKTLEIYQRDEIFARAADTGAYLQHQLQQFASSPIVGEVRGRGLIAAVDLHNTATNQAFPASVSYFLQQACQDNGLILRAVGGTAIAFCPPLIITRVQIDELISKFAAALKTTEEHVMANSLM